MEAYKLEVHHVGRCGNCHRFRNNLSYKVTDKVVCIDCFTMFKKQRLIDSIIAPEKKPKTEPNKPPKQPKTVKPKVIRTRQNNYRKLLFKFISNSDKPVVLNDLIGRGFGSDVTVTKNLRRLVKDGMIAFEIGKRGTRYYIGVNKKELLNSIPKREYRTGSRDKNKLVVQKIINASNRILTAKDLKCNIGVYRSTVFRVLKKLAEEKKIALIVCEKDRKFYFCKNDEKLVAELNKYSSDFVIEEVKEIIKSSGNIGISLTGVLEGLGKDYTNRYERSYLRKLIEKMEGIKWWKKDSCYYYYFD